MPGPMPNLRDLEVNVPETHSDLKNAICAKINK